MKRPILGVLAAVIITTTMDVYGLGAFSALPLLPLAGILWYLERLSAKEIGIAWGSLRGYGLALLYPLSVLGTMTLIVFLAGVVNLGDTDWKKIGVGIVLRSSIGALMVFLTEEGFFRGWLWASLKRAGLKDVQALVWSSVLFSVWHISAVSVESDLGFDLPASQIPVYLVNATVMGAIWGMLRLASGSVLVASVSHAVWNAVNYPLFAFGAKVGKLGVTETAIYGPEVGIVGLIANAVFAAVLWRWLKSPDLRWSQDAPK